MSIVLLIIHVWSGLRLAKSSDSGRDESYLVGHVCGISDCVVSSS